MTCHPVGRPNVSYPFSVMIRFVSFLPKIWNPISRPTFSSFVRSFCDRRNKTTIQVLAKEEAVKNMKASFPSQQNKLFGEQVGIAQWSGEMHHARICLFSSWPVSAPPWLCRTILNSIDNVLATLKQEENDGNHIQMGQAPSLYRFYHADVSEDLVKDISIWARRLLLAPRPPRHSGLASAFINNSWSIAMDSCQCCCKPEMMKMSSLSNKRLWTIYSH